LNRRPATDHLLNRLWQWAHAADVRKPRTCLRIADAHALPRRGSRRRRELCACTCAVHGTASPAVPPTRVPAHSRNAWQPAHRRYARPRPPSSEAPFSCGQLCYPFGLNLKARVRGPARSPRSAQASGRAISRSRCSIRGPLPTRHTSAVGRQSRSMKDGVNQSPLGQRERGESSSPDILLQLTLLE
jgi:hypothetical protein